MQLVYLTAKTYPATTADHVYIRFLARGFTNVLRKDFLLIVRGSAAEDLDGIPVRAVKAPATLRTLFYFFWLPLFIATKKESLIFFCNDFNLLSILCFWKPFFRKRMCICSDWHLMTGTWKDRFVAKGSDALITTSQALREAIIAKTDVSSALVHTVYGGIDLSPFRAPLAARAELGLPEGFLIGYVGLFRTMGKEKGLRTMINALTLLPEDVSCAFVGGSDAEIDEYKTYALMKSVGERCVWKQKQSFTMVAMYERSMDVLVIPYPDEPHFRDYGFPMKAYEYLASEVPIIYSKLPILDEVFKDRAESFMPGDAAALAQAVQRIREGVRSYRESEIDDYTWETKARSIIRIIEASRAPA